MYSDSSSESSNGYVENEEWDRENYLDPAWEMQQKKSFTAWCNSRLRHAGTQIEDITQDFQDGLKLMLLLEVISNETLPKPDRGKLRFHKIANVNKALDFIGSKGVRLASIGAEEIVDGNVKMTLGMIWTIILRFAIQDITVEDMSAKQGLLLWCQRKTTSYRNVNVQNFHTSFKDGLAFCALIHRHRPDLIDFDKLSKENAFENLKYAFDVAETYLDIPKMLDPEDMVNNAKPDERSVMAYVSSYYHAFSDAQKTESAAKRISKVIELNREKETLINTYEMLSACILLWIEEKMQFFEDRRLDENLRAIAAMKKRFHVYRQLEKPVKLEEKAALEFAYQTLQTRLQLSNRQLYEPSEGKELEVIDDRWSTLEIQEKNFEEWLLLHIRRLSSVDILIKRFHHRCKSHEEWIKSKSLFSLSMNTPATLSEAKMVAKKLECFCLELSSHEFRVDELLSIAEELRCLDYLYMDNINNKVDEIVTEWTRSRALSEEELQRIQGLLHVLQRIDESQIQFANEAVILSQKLEECLENVEDVLVIRTLQEAEECMQHYESWKTNLPKYQSQLDNLAKLGRNLEMLWQELNFETFGEIENPYSSISLDGLQAMWNKLQDLLPQREAYLLLEIEQHRSKGQRREEFMQAAQNLSDLMSKQKSVMKSVQHSTHSSLEEQRDDFAALDSQIVALREQVEKLELIEEECEEEECSTSEELSSSNLRTNWETLFLKIRRSSNHLENDILIRNSRESAEEQLKEYQNCFRHFDKNKIHRLDLTEFKACLVSLEYIVNGNDEDGESDFKKIVSSVDPEQTGYVTLDAFLNFMAQEASDTASNERLLHSFKALAQDKCYITAEILRRCLPLNDAEYCIERMSSYTDTSGETSQDALDYSSFINMLSDEPTLKNGNCL